MLDMVDYTLVKPPSCECYGGGQCNPLLGYRECVCDMTRRPCYIPDLGKNISHIVCQIKDRSVHNDKTLKRRKLSFWCVASSYINVFYGHELHQCLRQVIVPTIVQHVCTDLNQPLKVEHLHSIVIVKRSAIWQVIFETYPSAKHRMNRQPWLHTSSRKVTHPCLVSRHRRS